MMDWKEALGKLQSEGNLPEGEPEIQEQQPAPRKKDTLRVIVDKKGRKGKVATIIEGFTIDDDEVAEIAAKLKRRLGVGGSSRDGEILIQGACHEKVRQLLAEEGFKVK